MPIAVDVVAVTARGASLAFCMKLGVQGDRRCLAPVHGLPGNRLDVRKVNHMKNRGTTSLARSQLTKTREMASDIREVG